MRFSPNWQSALAGVGLAASLSFAALAADDSTDDSMTADESGRTCFWLSSINDFRAIDNHHVYVRGVGKDERYLLTLMNYCNGIRFTETIALESRPTERLCSNGNEHLTVVDGGGLKQRCVISDVQPVADIDEARSIVEAKKKDSSVETGSTGADE